jgi:hypothetical protein
MTVIVRLSSPAIPDAIPIASAIAESYSGSTAKTSRGYKAVISHSSSEVGSEDFVSSSLFSPLFYLMSAWHAPRSTGA